MTIRVVDLLSACAPNLITVASCAYRDLRFQDGYGLVVGPLFVQDFIDLQRGALARPQVADFAEPTVANSVHVSPLKIDSRLTTGRVAGVSSYFTRLLRYLHQSTVYSRRELKFEGQLVVYFVLS